MYGFFFWFGFGYYITRSETKRCRVRKSMVESDKVTLKPNIDLSVKEELNWILVLQSDFLVEGI
jgi:hypothetical protein